MSIATDWPSTGPDDPLHRAKHQKALQRVRAFCLDLANTAEKIARGHQPVMTVGGKNFAIFWRADSRPNVCFTAAPGVQDLLVRKNPERYFVPAYMGVRGWIGVRLDGKVDWPALEQIPRDAHDFSAHKPKVSGRKKR